MFVSVRPVILGFSLAVVVLNVPSNAPAQQPAPQTPQAASDEYFNPQTGDTTYVGAEEPPTGWKKMQPVPPLDTGLPPGTMISWRRGTEPRLYVDPATGEPHWIHFPQTPGSGWLPTHFTSNPQPVNAASSPASLTGRSSEADEYFNPQTGDTTYVGAGQTPPAGWKKMQPVPPLNAGLPPGTTISWIPGQEPRLYVDPATGEPHWIHFPETPSSGWLPTHFTINPQPANAASSPASQPGQASGSNEYFNPQTGDTAIFGPGQTPPPAGRRCNLCRRKAPACLPAPWSRGFEGRSLAFTSTRKPETRNGSPSQRFRPRGGSPFIPPFRQRPKRRNQGRIPSTPALQSQTSRVESTDYGAGSYSDKQNDMAGATLQGTVYDSTGTLRNDRNQYLHHRRRRAQNRATRL